MLEPVDFTIPTLGRCTIPSPVRTDEFTPEEERVLYDVRLSGIRRCREGDREPPAFECAGPRARIYFEPAKTKAAIVTCGGLCPGINDVIRSLVMCLHYRYGVTNVIGFRYGYQGLVPDYGHEVVELTPAVVERIHEEGGSFLASSRGHQDVAVMVDTLERLNVNILFCIGGDGTLRGAHAIAEEIGRRGLKIAVVGLPKTIDNDMCYIEKTFGFETAFTVAVEAIRSAHLEAKGAPNGIGLVKLMGRESGYLTANAALALTDANFVLVPEVPFDLDGERGFLEVLRRRMHRRHHAVILVAEGAGQSFFEDQVEFDASGNRKLQDIGLFLKERINRYFRELGEEVNLKYIDPSYIVRATPANASDSIYCTLLGVNAVHAAMAGKTDMVVGRWNNIFTHVPIPAVTRQRNKIDPAGTLWQSVIEVTGQPRRMVNEAPPEA
ncbi:MAG: ATP-dependent 6-phosphofructokinase [Nitrospirae bacterium]|nr:MAG: ATP-dependent 6-phosphofructokinase [Nitrospirota bacterium]